MSELLVMAYPDEPTAEQVMRALAALGKRPDVHLEDAVAVTKDKNEQVKLRQSDHRGRKGALAGGAIGLVAGALFLGGPVLGLAAGAIVGGLANRLRDVGISEDFVRQVSAQLRPESSALALMASAEDLDTLLPELARPGAVMLRTTLSPDAEARLRAALDDATPADAQPAP